MSVFEMKQGDRKRALKYRADDYDDQGRFAGASVAFRMKRRSGELVLDGDGVLLDANGIFGYAWSEGETDAPGEYHAEFVITFPGGLEETYPSSGFISVWIARDVS